MVIKTKKMWYKRKRKAGCLPPSTPPHTQTHIRDGQTISQSPHCSALALEGHSGPHICLPAPRQTWLLHPDSVDHTNHLQLMWTIRRSLAASITPPFFSEASPKAQCWAHWVLHIDHGYASLAQLGEASQRYCVCFVKTDRESILQSRRRHCMQVLRGGSSEVLNSVNSRLFSAAHRGLKWLPCAAPSAPLLGCVQQTVLTSFWRHKRTA